MTVEEFQTLIVGQLLRDKTRFMGGGVVWTVRQIIKRKDRIIKLSYGSYCHHMSVGEVDDFELDGEHA